jgi:hypothetical protein
MSATQPCFHWKKWILKTIKCVWQLNGSKFFWKEKTYLLMNDCTEGTALIYDRFRIICRNLYQLNFLNITRSHLFLTLKYFGNSVWPLKYEKIDRLFNNLFQQQRIRWGSDHEEWLCKDLGEGSHNEFWRILAKAETWKWSNIKDMWDALYKITLVIHLKHTSMNTTAIWVPPMETVLARDCLNYVTIYDYNSSTCDGFIDFCHL